tara:strand:- start:781 stop:1242 length:462 start_codon:yes stop_codon:yes gene_type:complete
MDRLEEIIKEQMTRAWWDLLQEDLTQEPPRMEHLKMILGEIHHTLCSFVPNLTDTHIAIKRDLLDSPPTVELQGKALYWIEKFQSPQWDSYTRKWKKELPEDTVGFLKKYYYHLDRVQKEVKEYREKLRRGEDLFRPPKPPTSLSDINMKTGR